MLECIILSPRAQENTFVVLSHHLLLKCFLSTVTTSGLTFLNPSNILLTVKKEMKTATRMNQKKFTWRLISLNLTANGSIINYPSGQHELIYCPILNLVTMRKSHKIAFLISYSNKLQNSAAEQTLSDIYLLVKKRQCGRSKA